MTAPSWPTLLPGRAGALGGQAGQWLSGIVLSCWLLCLHPDPNPVPRVPAPHCPGHRPLENPVVPESTSARQRVPGGKAWDMRWDRLSWRPQAQPCPGPSSLPWAPREQCPWQPPPPPPRGDPRRSWSCTSERPPPCPGGPSPLYRSSLASTCPDDISPSKSPGHLSPCHLFCQLVRLSLGSAALLPWATLPRPAPPQCEARLRRSW